MGVDVAEEQPFGPYLVYERLGVGGMATVHRALERGIEGFERIVALKRLLPHLAEDASFIKSFVREAKLASLLNHVNIVQIFELGRVGTEYFISMEYIDGRDIRRILRHARKVTGPPPIHVTVGLVLQLCEALDYAHVKTDDAGTPLGIVHRDVSPSNLLVTSGGHVKVIDFGIAKAQSQQLRTQTGRVKGKLAYMAPEALSGKDLDARSDLFAAGVILHELLTARPLFARKNEYETLVKVQKGEIDPPSTFNQAVPPELDAICMRALERDPDQRWSNAAEMRDALHDLRRSYNLQTGHRDIAQWLAWAFSIEAPSASFAAAGTGGDHSLSAFDARQMRRTPLPRKEDEEAVEIAWGGGEAEGNALPVVLDDVPDVSEKHLAPGSGAVRTSDAQSAARRAFIADLEDDIPAPTPSHGRLALPLPPPPSRPSTASVATSTVVARPRTTAPHIVPPSPHTPPPSRVTPLPTRNTPVPAMPRTPDSSATFEAPRERRITARGVGAGDDDVDTLRGDIKRSQLERAVPETLDPEAELPQVRFKPPTNPPGELITARPSTLSIPDSARHKATADITIGHALIERRTGKKTWLVAAGVGTVGVAAAVALFAMRGDQRAATAGASASAVHTTPERVTGTVKFSIEPADAEIKVIDKQLAHVGSPWSTQLEPGNYQIQIHRTGYKSWLTSLELSANETQTLRVVLEPLSTHTVAAEATLMLGSTPDGLDAFLDGKPLGITPVKAQLAPGRHTIVLKQDGAEVWRHELEAKASANYEFSPSMSETKRRERAQRAAPIARRDEVQEDSAPASQRPDKPDRSDERDKPVEPPPPAVTTDKTVEKPAETAKPPPAPAVQVAKPAATPPPAPAPTPAAVAVPRATPAPAPRRRGPVIVPPTAVKRLSGSVPTVGKSKRADVPPVVAAKVCIDTAGKVTTVAMITKLERLTSVDLSNAIQSWRYAPYKQQGIAVPACFVVSFRVQ